MMFCKRLYRCTCSKKEGGRFQMYLRRKNAVIAAVDFTETIDTLENGFPVLNGLIGPITIKDSITCEVVEYGMKVEKKYVYHPDKLLDRKQWPQSKFPWS